MNYYLNLKGVKSKVTDSLEEYLYSIYALSKNNEGARVTDIANKMEVTKASTNNALNQLKEAVNNYIL